jgi:predicted secreted protein
MVTVAAGEPFDVELGSSPSTGYTWQLEPPSGVQHLGTDFSQQPDAAVGDGGTAVFHLKTEHAGHFELHFELRRRWESEPVTTKQIDVDSR